MLTELGIIQGYGSEIFARKLPPKVILKAADAPNSIRIMTGRSPHIIPERVPLIGARLWSS